MHYLYVIFVWNAKILVTGPLKSHSTHLWSHPLLFVGGMGLGSIAAVCSAGTSVCVCVLRDVTGHSQIIGCCFPGALQHVTVGSRIKGNTLQPVNWCSQASFPVFCAVGKWWLMLLCLLPCQEKPFALFSVFLLLCHENAVNKEPGPVWCRAARAWLGSAPLQVPQRAVRGWCGSSILEILKCLSCTLDFHLTLVGSFCAKWLMRFRTFKINQSVPPSCAWHWALLYLPDLFFLVQECF